MSNGQFAQPRAGFSAVRFEFLGDQEVHVAAGSGNDIQDLTAGRKRKFEVIGYTTLRSPVQLAIAPGVLECLGVLRPVSLVGLGSKSREADAVARIAGKCERLQVIDSTGAEGGRTRMVPSTSGI